MASRMPSHVPHQVPRSLPKSATSATSAAGPSVPSGLRDTQRVVLPPLSPGWLLAAAAALLAGVAFGITSSPTIRIALVSALVIVLLILLQQYEVLAAGTVVVTVLVDWDGLLPNLIPAPVIGLGLAALLLGVLFLVQSRARPWISIPQSVLWALFLVAGIPPVLHALEGDEALKYYAVTFVGSCIMYVLGTQIAVDISRLRRLLSLLAGVAALIALHGIIYVRTRVFLLETQQLHDYLASVQNFPLSNNSLLFRSGSLLLNPNANGAFLALLLFVPIGLFASSRSWWARLLYAGEAVLIALGLFYTYSIASELAVAVGVVALAGLTLRRRYILLVGAAALALAAPTVALALWLAPREMSGLVQHALGSSELVLRIGLWQTAIRVIHANPYTGVGLGLNSYFFRAEPFRSAYQYRPYYSPHNSYLEIAAMAGLPALALLLTILARALQRARRVYRSYARPERYLLAAAIAAIVAGSVNAFDMQWWTIVPLVVPAWLIVGAMASPALMRSARTAAEPEAAASDAGVANESARPAASAGESRQAESQTQPALVCVPIPAFPLPGGVRSVLRGVADVMAGEWQMEYLTRHVGPHGDELVIRRFGGRLASPWQFPNVWFYAIAGGFRLRALLRHGRPYQIILPQDGLATGAFAAVVAKRAGLSVLCIDHGTVTLLGPLGGDAYRRERLAELQRQPALLRMVSRARYWLYWPSLRLFGRIAARSTDVFLAAGDDVAEAWHTELRVAPERIIRFPFLVDSTCYRRLEGAERADKRAGMGLPADAIVITLVNRLSAEKGIDTAIAGIREAMAVLASELRERVRVLIVGDGPLRAETEAWITRDGMADCSQMMGEATPEEVASYVGISDVFVYAGTRAINSMSVLEAMAAQCAVIASTQPRSMAALLADGRGVAIPANDVQALASALAQLVADPQLRLTMGAAARAYIVEHHSAAALKRALLLARSRVTGAKPEAEPGAQAGGNGNGEDRGESAQAAGPDVWRDATGPGDVPAIREAARHHTLPPRTVAVTVPMTAHLAAPALALLSQPQARSLAGAEQCQARTAAVAVVVDEPALLPSDVVAGDDWSDEWVGDAAEGSATNSNQEAVDRERTGSDGRASVSTVTPEPTAPAPPQHSDDFRAILSNLLKSSGVYALASLAGPLISIMLAPFLTRELSASEYGLLAILNTMIGLIAGISQLGLASAFFRAYNFDYSSERDHNSVLTTSLLILCVVAIPLVIAAALLGPFLGQVLFDNPSAGPLIALAVGVVLVQNLTVPGFAWLRAEARTHFFSLLAIGNLVVALTMNFVLVGVFHLGIAGSLLATGAGYLLVSVCTVPVILIHAGFRPHWDVAYNLLSFGIPMVFGFMSYWVLQLSDRYLLSLFASLAQTARYTVAYNLGGVLSTAVVTPFVLAWPHAMYTIAKRGDYANLFRLIFRGFGFFLLFAAFAFSLVGHVLLDVLFPASYGSAAPIIPLIATAIVFFGVYNVFMVGSGVRRKTWMGGTFTSIAALVNFGLNLYLIPHYGAIGAALSTLIAYIVLAIAGYIGNQIIYPIPFEVGRFTQATLVGVGLYAGFVLLSAVGGTVGAWLAGAVALVVYAAYLLVLAGGSCGLPVQAAVALAVAQVTARFAPAAVDRLSARWRRVLDRRP